MKKLQLLNGAALTRIARISLLLLFFAAIVVSPEYQAAALQNCSPLTTINKEGTDRIIFTDGSQQYPYTLNELALVRMGSPEEDGLPGHFITCLDPSLLSYKLFWLSQKINRPAVEAGFYLDEKENIQIQQEQTGKELDLGLLITSFGNPCFYQEIYPLPVKRIFPRVTAAELTDKAPMCLWSEYTTRLTDIPDRTENIRVASRKLHGLIIEPGAEVSFNDVVGPREPEQGYREAQIIVGGKFEPGLGGGVCQVSSTFYNTILLAGFKTTERHNHSVRIGYVPLGCDATVVYGQRDLKFVNTSDSYLLIKTKLSGLDLSISLYGSVPIAYERVELYTKVLKTLPPKEQYVVENHLAPGEEKIIEKGSNGYITATYRACTSDSARTTELISEDYYAPTQTIIARSPKLNEKYLQRA